MRDDDPIDVIRRIKLIKGKQRALMLALDDLVDEAGDAIRAGRLDVRALAVEDLVQACWLLREAGLVPNLKEAHRRVKGLLAKEKP